MQKKIIFSKQRITAFGLLLFVVLPSGCAKKAVAPLRMYAGAGLRNATEALASAFEQETNIHIDIDYAGSGIILTRAQADPQADLFMPGDVWYIDRLQELNQSVQTATPVASLRPVLLVAKRNPKNIHSLSDLQRPEIQTALGSQKACQIGRLCGRLLEQRGLDWSRIVDKESLTVNELAVWVKMHDVDATVVWDATAATVADQTETIAIDLAANETSPVSCALLTTATQPKAALKFIRFMASPNGQALLKKHGFSGAKNPK